MDILEGGGAETDEGVWGEGLRGGLIEVDGTRGGLVDGCPMKSQGAVGKESGCLLYTSPSPRD